MSDTPADYGERDIETEVARIIPLISSLTEDNREFVTALIEGDDPEQLADDFTSGDARTLYDRMQNVLCRQLKFDTALPLEFVRIVLERATAEMRIKTS